MPTWLSLVLPSLLAFAGAYLGQFLARRSAKELDRWRKREETMRMLRWAAEISLGPDPERRRLGARMLEALDTAELVQAPDRPLVSAAGKPLVSTAERRYDEGEDNNTGAGSGGSP